MDNPDTLATFSTQDTGRRQNTKAQHNTFVRLYRKDKGINNDLLITTRTPLKTVVNLGTPEGSAVHDPLMTPVLLMLKDIKIICSIFVIFA
jgi:hypothetical protein